MPLGDASYESLGFVSLHGGFQEHSPASLKMLNNMSGSNTLIMLNCKGTLEMRAWCRLTARQLVGMTKQTRIAECGCTKCQVYRQAFMLVAEARAQVRSFVGTRVGKDKPGLMADVVAVARALPKHKCF